MIIIITGATHVGKTRLAQLMMEKYHYPYVSIDHIKMGLIRSGYTDLTPLDDDKLTDYLWPIIREMIKTAIENKQNLIVEGCYIPCNYKEDFSSEYFTKIKYICLCMSDKYIDTNYEKIIKYSSCIENRIDDSYCTIDSLKNDNHYYYEGCKKNHLDIIMIDDDYDETLNKILNKKI